MIRNYLKVTLRNLMKYRSASVLNILGLGFGIACCMLCYLHIQFELGFDQYHVKGERLFRITAGDPTADHWVKVAAPIPPALASQVPEIEDYIRFTGVSYNPKVMVSHDEDRFLEPYFMMADASFMEAFTIRTIEGDPTKALADLNSVVITQSVAQKLFGAESALGKIITLEDNQLDFQVGGVVEDVPEQSHFRFDYLISFDNLDRVYREGSSQSWGQYNWFAYLLLHEQADASVVEQKIQAAKVSLPDSEEITFEGLFLQPITDIHFNDHRGNMFPSYDIRYIYVFITIAIALLAIACINYINLSISLSIKRIKEIGVRKAVGASRHQLVYQFINEALLTSALALAIGILILHLIVPYANLLFGSAIVVDYGDVTFVALLGGVTLLVGLTTGSYLAFYVNRFKASTILKGGLATSSSGLGLQRALIFVQFSISTLLIISSLIISNQVQFLNDKDIGFAKDQVVCVPISKGTATSKVEELKNRLAQSTRIAGASASSFVPGKANWNQTVWWEGQTEPVSMFIISIDKDFLETMNVGLLEGSMTDVVNRTETQYILNESARNFIGWQNAMGRPFSPFGESNKLPIRAVTKDFHFMSLHHQIAPLVLVISDRFSLDQLFVRVADGNLSESLNEIEQAYRAVLGDIPFEFSFLDDRVEELYQSEMQVQRIVSYLTVIAVLFALMGVYGLISFSIENKTKEIAIRKVLGIAPYELLILFSKRYYGLMLIAFAVSAPVAWLLLSDWLANFSYRIDISTLWFAAAFLLVMVSITVIGLIKYVSIGQVNPAHALKYE